MPEVRPGRDPLLTDCMIAVAVAVVLIVNGAVGQYAHGVDPFGVLAALAAATPLLFRRRAPVLVLGLTAVGVFACLATLKPVETVPLAPMVALYTVAAQLGRRAALWGAAAMVPVALAATGWFSPHGILHFETFKNLIFIGLPVALGLGVRDRCRYIMAIKERAERAERTREEEALRRVGEERLRIAREVHDVVAHAMVAINVQAGVAAHVIDRRPQAARDALTEIKRVSGESLADLRATLGVLREPERPAPTRPTPGIGALEELVERTRSAGPQIELRIDRGAEIPVAVDAAAYRIVQEALTNTLRHAGAARAQVRIEATPDRVEVEVLDDGAAGGEPDVSGSGHGLDGMRERAAAVGGQVEAGPRPDGGWRVWARLPVLAPDRA